MVVSAHTRLACRRSGFDPRTRHVTFGIKTTLATLETVYHSRLDNHRNVDPSALLSELYHIDLDL